MPEAASVTPQKWEDITILYDDGEYSAIWGTFHNVDEDERRLGVRWNRGKDNDLGYPNYAGNPVWYCELPSLEEPILFALLANLVSSTTIKNREEYIDNIAKVLRERGES